MALPAGFLDELRVRTPLQTVVGRRVRLIRSGRQSKGCCPFHGEKTPSFYVYDDHFHCFGCGAHGDAISFVMQSQRASFTEAVEQLAAEAGLDVPKPTPAAAEAERRRLQLNDVLAAAGTWYQRQLYETPGAAALTYLRGRGLSEATIRRFGLGWSGDGRGALAAGLAGDGVEIGMLVDAGLMKAPDETQSGGRAVDLFFGRVMFPIRDRRGRIISFGGRVLGDAMPKYVNGPETALFSKRRTLYGLDFAREAARGGALVVAVEGYMDVIALHQAGFGGAVAPLGTALTDEQLGELWKLSPAPILCFDGDGAGARAAARAVDIALPLLAADRTLRIARLQSGEDPDTIVRRGGPGAFEAVLAMARPLSDALYDIVKDATGDSTPEQRAALRGRLDATAERIGDRALAAEYRRALRDRFYAERAQARNAGQNSPWRGSGRAGGPGSAFTQGATANRGFAAPRPTLTPETGSSERARTLVAILLRHPELLHDVEEAFGHVALSPGLERLRAAMLDYSDHAAAAGKHVLDSAELMNHLTSVGLAAEAVQALAAVPYPLAASASPGAMPAEAVAGWWHMFGLINRGRLEEEVAAAMRHLAENPGEAAQHRLIALCTARNALSQGEEDGAAEY